MEQKKLTRLRRFSAELGIDAGDQTLIDTWQQSAEPHDRQRRALKAGNPGTQIKTVLISGELATIRANANLSRVQWFIFDLLHNQAKTANEINNGVEKYKDVFKYRLT